MSLCLFLRVCVCVSASVGVMDLAALNNKSVKFYEVTSRASVSASMSVSVSMSVSLYVSEIVSVSMTLSVCLRVCVCVCGSFRSCSLE